MEKYLAIITSMLVLTQIIRVTQNQISLYRQEREVKRNVSWIKEVEATKEDFRIQREYYRLAYEKLKDEYQYKRE